MGLNFHIWWSILYSLGPRKQIMPWDLARYFGGYQGYCGFSKWCCRLLKVYFLHLINCCKETRSLVSAKNGRVRLLKSYYLFITVTKHSNLFLLDRQQAACARCQLLQRNTQSDQMKFVKIVWIKIMEMILPNHSWSSLMYVSYLLHKNIL